MADGCTDGTAQRARSCQRSPVRVVELSGYEGKARLSRGCEAAKGTILVLADAQQPWAADSLRAVGGLSHRSGTTYTAKGAANVLGQGVTGSGAPSVRRALLAR